MSEIDRLSAQSIPILSYKDDICLGPASGFIYRHLGVDYLVSNWHVFSGRDTYSGQPLHKMNATPNNFRITLHGSQLGKRIEGLQVSLLKPNGEPAWMQHSQGQDIDVAAIRLSDLPSNARMYPVNNHTFHSDLALHAGAEVFILGYPRGLSKQANIPVWKKGSVASEPEVEMDDGTPTVLVDTATREGMSGAPVYIGSSTATNRFIDGSVSQTALPIYQFIGIYSGRFGADQSKDLFLAQLARFFKRRAIEQLFEEPAPANCKLRKNSTV
ncbi:S1 family peptidase [Aliishimia ponticola]|uniref:S1 family peptidase n=1 Tax=Aliishimia ponticola TaxID=2499833 RepID=UPI00145620D6|nr:serine protease [Aliishimia ponticola]